MTQLRPETYKHLVVTALNRLTLTDAPSLPFRVIEPTFPSQGMHTTPLYSEQGIMSILGGVEAHLTFTLLSPLSRFNFGAPPSLRPSMLLKEEVQRARLPHHLLELILRGMDIKSQLACTGVNSPCRTCALAATAALLSHGANPNAVTSKNATALHVAALSNKHAIMDLLLSHGADINFKDRDGNTPLIISTRQGNLEAVTVLLRKGADIDMCNSYGATALHKAAEGNYLEVAHALLAAGAYVDSRDIMRRTPLHTAAGQGHAALLDLLITHGACVNVKNSFISTPLHAAAMGGHVEVVQKCLEAGVDTRATDARGCIAWDLACQYKRVHVMELLEGFSSGTVRFHPLWLRDPGVFDIFG